MQNRGEKLSLSSGAINFLPVKHIVDVKRKEKHTAHGSLKKNKISMQIMN